MNKLKLLLILLIITLSPSIYGQDYLLKERENEIKTSGKYYWGEGSDFIEDIAKLNASVELSNQILKDAVGQTEQQDEILKAISTGAHLERLQQQGKIKILAWIDKDSVLLTVTTQRPITQRSEPKPKPSSSLSQQVIQPNVASAPKIDSNPVAAGNSVLQQLTSCKTYREVKRVATMNGLVRGEIGKGSSGFTNPENCIIAVFTKDGVLSALLDTGGSSRTDLLSGNTIQNPEQFYDQEEYSLWYMQVKKMPSNVQSSNNTSLNQPTQKQPVQNSVASSQKTVKAPPPIVNTNSEWMWNAIIRLPKNWHGKSILANGFVFIDIKDKNLQNKYNVHPGQHSPKDGHIYFDENNCFSDACWHEIWDDDDRFYEYPLSSKVVLEAFFNDLSDRHQMTSSQFADYYWQQPNYCDINPETGEEYGMLTNITYKNGVITKIVKVYLP